MPKAVGRLPAYATASFRKAVLAEHAKEKEQPQHDATNTKAVDVTPKPADNSSVQCHACNTTVYEMEKLVADNYAYHKKCFKCCKCDRILRVGNYASMDAQIYCKPHFVECFKQNGNYEEGFGKEKLSLRNTTTQEGRSSDEKENVPSATGQATQLERTNSSEVTAAPAPPPRPVGVSVTTEKPTKNEPESQSVTSLNPTEFTLALEEKKRKLMQAAQASVDKSKERSYKPTPGRLRPPTEHLSSGQQSPTGVADSPSTAQVSSEAGGGAGGISVGAAVAAQNAAVRQRHVDSPARRDARPISWNCQAAAAADSQGSAEEEEKRISHASAAAATIAPGSIKMKLLDLEAAKEASRAAAAVQRQLRMEADARAAAEAAATLAEAASEAASASDDVVPVPEPAGVLPLRLAEVATVKSKFESGEASVSPVQQTAAREEVEQFRSQVGPRAAAIRSRFQKRAADKAGLSAARSLPDLSPAGDIFDGEEAVDDASGSLDDDGVGPARVPSGTARMDAETAPKPGQLKNILSKLQSMQEDVDKKERARPRPLQIPAVDRHCSDGGNAQGETANESSDGVQPDAKYSEQLWPKKAKSLREKFECKEEQSSEGQPLQSPKRPKPINILAEIEAYEQHNKAMGMKVKYVVESKGADRSAADTPAADAATTA